MKYHEIPLDLTIQEYQGITVDSNNPDISAPFKVHSPLRISGAAHRGMSYVPSVTYDFHCFCHLRLWNLPSPSRTALDAQEFLGTPLSCLWISREAMLLSWDVGGDLYPGGWDTLCEKNIECVTHFYLLASFSLGPRYEFSLVTVLSIHMCQGLS